MIKIYDCLACTGISPSARLPIVVHTTRVQRYETVSTHGGRDIITTSESNTNNKLSKHGYSRNFLLSLDIPS
jgi:hypothetical protein